MRHWGQWTLAAVFAAATATTSHAQPARKTVAEVLKSPLTVKFENEHVSAIAETIEHIYPINFVLDSRVITPKKPPQSVTDGMVQRIELKNVTVDEALHAILDPLHLAYVVRDDYVWISTPESIKYPVAYELETRSYRLSTSKVPDVNSAIHSNTAPEVDIVALIARILPIKVDPESGKPLSFVRFNVQTNELVVHDSLPNLGRVEQLLKLVFGEIPPHKSN